MEKNYLRFEMDVSHVYVRVKTIKEAKKLIEEYQDHMTFMYHHDSATANHQDFVKNSRYRYDLPQGATFFRVPDYSDLVNMHVIEVDGLTDKEKLDMVDFFNTAYVGTNSRGSFFALEFFYVFDYIKHGNSVPVKLFCLADWEEDFIKEFPEVWKKMQQKDPKWSLQWIVEDFNEDPVHAMKEELIE